MKSYCLLLRCLSADWLRLLQCIKSSQISLKHIIVQGHQILCYQATALILYLYIEVCRHDLLQIYL